MHRCIVEYDGAELTEDSRMTLGEWLDIWLKECAEPSVRPSHTRATVGMQSEISNPPLAANKSAKVTRRK